MSRRREARIREIVREEIAAWDREQAAMLAVGWAKVQRDVAGFDARFAALSADREGGQPHD